MSIRTVGAAFLLALLPAHANDLGGQSAYRLSDPNARAVKLQTLDLRERRRGGAFEFNTINNIDRQINCNFSVSATGNAASPTHSGSGISPVGLQGSGLNASTTGNQSEASNSASGVNSTVSGSIAPSRPTQGGVVIEQGIEVATTNTNTLNTNAPGTYWRNGQPFPVLGSSTSPEITIGNPTTLNGNSQLNSGSHAANGTNVNQVGQSNTGSTLTSGISNSPTTVTIGDVNANGAEILNSVDTSQSIEGTEIAANVEGSRACDFVETTP